MLCIFGSRIVLYRFDNIIYKGLKYLENGTQNRKLLPIG